MIDQDVGLSREVVLLLRRLHFACTVGCKAKVNQLAQGPMIEGMFSHRFGQGRDLI